MWLFGIIPSPYIIKQTSVMKAKFVYLKSFDRFLKKS